ncbi:4-alpha-glucanotransferase [Arcanobacterium hippocoleae]|uniref:4-alpha-glucanotransferase n=1 Tax=Arcanobacterium hippocoleae TaxID=149017 RepID=A0ABU1T1A0_9ACTO|nr:4-alpha-glucanotransferase [Arcanobacterium hippocoleae]MDR6939159.1 4-alpha-glucanotransferase [Arcanobacterium hippocoleae]
MEVTDLAGLQELAHAYGVATEFWGYDGKQKIVPAHTLVQVLAAMGVENINDATLDALIEQRQLRNWYRVLPQVVIARNSGETRVEVHVPHGASVRLEIELESGGWLGMRQCEDFTIPREIDGVLTGQAAFIVPQGIELGYHKLHAYVNEGTEDAQHETVTLIGVPHRLPAVDALYHPESKRSWGMMEQLYSVRSRDSWGIGDLRDLSETCAIFGDFGADFVLINPLHAAQPTGIITPSPYLPVTRRFFNPIYIRPEDIAETAYLSVSERSLVEWAGEKVKQLSLKNTLIDRDAAWKAKREALEVIFRVPRSYSREQEFRRFKELEGEGLENFALWCAIYEKYAGAIPSQLSEINSHEVNQERHDLRERTEFWAWLQWVMDQQLAQAQKCAKAAGMRYGICHDLAVGVHPEGSDTWSIPQAFAKGVGVGAPPDMYNQQGQNWSQPPWNPAALEAMDYTPLRDMARTVLRHAGALRVDHVMGLFRLWWIPNGNSAKDGTYVRFDHEAMVGVLLLEAYRAGAVLIGEDLGTVEPWVRDYLIDRGILGTSVFWFEKQDDGTPLHADQYRRGVFATVDTHDLPPAAGYLAEEHVDLRAKLGLLELSEADTRAQAREERRQVISRLSEYGLLSEESLASIAQGREPATQDLIEAMHLYIARTASVLLGVSLTDAVGERRAQNQPGTDQEYPNWRIPLADGTENVVLVEDLPANPRLKSLVERFTAELRS